jgi:prolyl oligopeptidase
MKKTCLRLAAIFLALAARAAAADAPDPRAWLEDVESPRALAWVASRDSATLAGLQRDPRWNAVEADARAVTLAEDRIPWPELRGGRLYNFWQDRAHVRGVWRRTTVDE